MSQGQNTKLLIVGFATILLGMVGLMVLFVLHINAMVKKDQINDDLMQKNFAAYAMRDAIENRSYSLLRAISLDDFFDRDAERLKLDGYALEFHIAQSRIDPGTLSSGETAAMDRILLRVAESRPVVDDAMDHVVDGQWNSVVQEKIANSNDVLTRVHEALNIFVAEVEAETSRQRLELQELRERERKVFPLLGMALIVVSAAVGLFVVRREIAHRKLLEQRVEERSNQLSARETHYRTIIETAADGIITTNDRGVIESFNPASERIFGYQTSEVIGQNVTILMPEHDSQRHDLYMSKYLAGGPPQIIGEGRELIGRRKTGETFPIWLAINPMQVDNQTKFVGIVSDISAQKTAENEVRLLSDDNEIVASILRLSLSSEDLDHTLQMALDLVLDRQNLDLQGKGCIFLMDDRSGDLVMRAQSNLTDPLLQTCDRVAVGQCLCGKAAETRQAVEKTCMDDDHEIRIEGADDHGHICVPIMYANDNLGVLNLVTPHGHEVTDHERRLVWSVADALAGIVHRHNKEEELRLARDHAQAANRTKTEFLANMSHELRTPLNAIIGYSEMMENEVFGPVGADKYKEYLDYISGSGHHLYDLINDLLDVSRIETDEFPLDETVIGINELIDDCLATVKTRSKQAGNTVTYLSKEGLPAIKVDKRRLKQVVLNLLNNAIKFTKKNGTITVSVEWRPDDRLCIRVTDTGIGIAEDDLESVFDMFGQVDSSLSRKYDGVGLGLPLSRKLIEKHGGELNLQSTLGYGTTATISLPPTRVIWN